MSPINNIINLVELSSLKAKQIYAQTNISIKIREIFDGIS